MKKLFYPVLAAVVFFLCYSIGDFTGVTGTRHELLEETAPDGITEVSKEGLAPNRYADVYVVRVVDGDTLEVTYDGETKKVRLLCVDTPESKKSGVAVQPYAGEAAEFTSALILNKSVRLVFEKGLNDRYGRLLAHVLLKDGRYLNGMLVKNGMARVVTYSPNTRYSDYFHKLQAEAVAARRGFWELPAGKRPFELDEKGKYVPAYELKKAS